MTENSPSKIDTGDYVHHGPSGEDWTVAIVDGDDLYWCGWPPGRAKLSDCTLKEKASPERRDSLLRDVAAMRNDESQWDPRSKLAKARLGIKEPADLNRELVADVAARRGITLGHLRNDGGCELAQIMRRLDAAEGALEATVHPEPP